MVSVFDRLHQSGDTLVSLLGLATVKKIDMGNNMTSPCFVNCTLSSDCYNGTCICPCADNNVTYGAAFASFSYLLLLISTIQLVLVIVYDAVQEDKEERSRWRKAFRITVQKCLLGAVIMATGTRAIYYTVISYIPTKWADILLNLYYPAFLSAFSLLICFWAEFFYHSSPVDGRHFLSKYKYSVSFLVFNVIVYLLLFADIIATPLVSDQEQLQMSGIVGTIFAFLLFMTLIGFLHFAIRLFFRPDWQPFSIQLAVLKINLRQQAASVCGIVTNAFMQTLIIALLVFNMVGRFIYIDSRSLYVCAILIRVTELVLPVWFCCSLWNYKQPKTLWILNPRLILKLDRNREDVESKPILSSDTDAATADYGAIQRKGTNGVLEASTSSQDEGFCWVCQGTIEAPKELFYPCNCQLHRNCIKEWVAKRASNSNIAEREYLKCQVCRQKYRIKRFTYVCIPKGLQTKHWVQLFAVLFILGVSVAGCIYAGGYSTLGDKAKIATICCVAVFNAILLKLLGCGMVLAWRRSKYKTIDIKGISVDKWREKKKTEERERERTQQERSVHEHQGFLDSNSSLSESVRYSHTAGTVTVISEERVGGESGVAVLGEGCVGGERVKVSS